MIAIGIGCRKGCAAEEIVELVRRACGRAGVDVAAGPRLCTIAEKQGEAGMIEAASALGLPLVFLPKAALAAVEPDVQTRSQRVTALFGTPSVAEAAALAGAGEGGRLLLPRFASARATCAIATTEIAR